MATYCAKFIPQFSDLSEPLGQLIKENNHFCWTTKEHQSLNKIKTALISETAVTYFNKSKKTELFTDASPTGLLSI